MIILKEHNHTIGYISVSEDDSHDFGCGLLKEYWGNGLITEASLAVVHFLKEKGWQYVTATHDIHNIASGKVMGKIGMSYKYSYVEQWQPKNISVTFRLYQLNFDDDQERVYQDYWENYPEYFIEELRI